MPRQSKQQGRRSCRAGGRADASGPRSRRVSIAFGTWSSESPLPPRGGSDRPRWGGDSCAGRLACPLLTQERVKGADLNRPVRERVREQPSGRQEPAQNQQGTGVHQPTLPNQRREDAGQQGRGQQGGGSQQSEHGGDPRELAQALRNGGATGIARAVGRLTVRDNGLPLTGAGTDHVLLNVGLAGRHTFALGSLLPRRYLRLFYKQNQGKPLRVAHWLDEDQEGGEGEPRAAITAEEYEQIVREMTLARLNRPMNRVLLANGGYDDV